MAGFVHTFADSFQSTLLLSLFYLSSLVIIEISEIFQDYCFSGWSNWWSIVETTTQYQDAVWHGITSHTQQSQKGNNEKLWTMILTLLLSWYVLPPASSSSKRSCRFASFVIDAELSASIGKMFTLIPRWPSILTNNNTSSFLNFPQTRSLVRIRRSYFPAHNSMC